MAANRSLVIASEVTRCRSEQSGGASDPMSCAHPCRGGPASAKAKIISLRIMTIFRDLGSQRGLPMASRCWTEDPQGRRFAGIGSGGDEQPVEVGDKQRGSRAGYRG